MLTQPLHQVPPQQPRPAQVLDLRPRLYVAAYQGRQAQQLKASKKWQAIISIP